MLLIALLGLALEGDPSAERGDFRHFWSDDQAAQVLVAFDDRHILTYIWDTTAPQGTMENASSPPLVHIYAIVCRSGMAEANRWIAESHNVAADYLKAFRKTGPPRERAEAPDQFAAHWLGCGKLLRGPGFP